MDYSRLSMRISEAIFTQRSIRRFLPDPIPMEDIRQIIVLASGCRSGRRTPSSPPSRT